MVAREGFSFGKEGIEKFYYKKSRISTIEMRLF